jgi:hypothetical protein
LKRSGVSNAIPVIDSNSGSSKASCLMAIQTP